MRNIVNTAAILGIIATAGCAPKPEDVVGTYVSPTLYSTYSCKQIITERNAVVQKVNELTGVQAQKAQNDATTTAVGAILFWPALFFVGHDNNAPQLAAAKGNYDALTAEGTAKGCF